MQERAHISDCPNNSSGINLFGAIMVQADSCLHAVQIDTDFLSVGCQDGGWGMGHFGPEAQIIHVTVMGIFLSFLCHL